MAVPYEKIVAEDLNTGLGTVDVTMPGGGLASGNKVNLGSFPAIAAAASRAASQSITTATLTTVQLSTEDLDYAGWYDPTTYTFTPLKAGVYLFMAQGTLELYSGTFTLEIYRGVTSIGKVEVFRTALAATAQVVAVASMNGSTDAITVKVTHDSAGSLLIGACTFAAILLGSV